MRVEDGSGETLYLHDSLIAATHNIIVDGFLQEISPRAVTRIAENIYAQTAGLQAEVLRVRKPAIACAKGCAWCCTSYVSVTTLEAIYLIAYIRANFSPEEIETLKERTAQAAQRRRGLDSNAQEALRLFCPLLKENACSVYAARPLMCRGWTSRDANICRTNVEQPGETPIPVPYYRLFKEIAASVRVGVQSGIEQTPLQNDDLELVSALNVALNTPNIVERWLAGEQVFPNDIITKE
jgi:hypothetical protein